MASSHIRAYDILDPLPRGGPGRVFRARITQGAAADVGTEIQLRVLNEAEAGGPAAIDALLRDHEAARAAETEAVLAPLDFGVWDGREGRRFYATSRLFRGRTLNDLLAEIGSIPDLLAEAIARHVAEALVALHKAGVCAIGLSPQTLLVREDTSVAVLDAGFGAAYGAAWPKSGVAPPSLACAAPEMIRARESADGRADLYSLGALLFRSMTERWPRPDDAQALRCEPASFPARRPSELRQRLSAVLDELVHTLLATDREERLASAEELVEVLEKRRRSAWWRSRESLRAAAIGSAPAPAAETPPPAAAPAAPIQPPDGVWLAARTTGGFRLGRHPCAMIERREELADLVDAATRMSRKSGEVRFVQGAGGAGKTRLVDALFEALDGLPESTAPIALAGGHRRLGIGRPMRAFSEALTRLLVDGRDVEAAQVAPLLCDAPPLVPAFAAFLSGREPPRDTATLSRETLAHAFCSALTRLAAIRPVVLVVEDLQWADPEGLELFARLGRLAAEIPLFLVGTHRPCDRGAQLAQLHASLAVHDHVATMRLQPLGLAGTSRLVQSLVETSEAAAALAARVYVATRGVPLRVVETLRVLETEGALVRTEGGGLAVGESAPEARLPEAAHELWRRRLAPLSSAARSYLAMAAVQGAQFDGDVVRRAIHEKIHDAEATLETLVAARLVEPVGAAHRFAHQELFDHVHDALEDAEIETCQAATADAFLAARNPQGRPPADVQGVLSYRVAWHYLLAGRGERGLLFVDAALRHLRSTWRLGDADRLAELAIRALASSKDRGALLCDLLLARADIVGRQSRRAEQRELLSDALLRARDLRDGVREARALHEAARLSFVLGRFDESTATCGEAVAAAQRASDPSLEARCEGLHAAIAFRERRRRDARVHASRMLDLAKLCGDAFAESEALQTLGTLAQGEGMLENADEFLHMALEGWRRLREPAREADALATLGNVAAAAGDLMRAEELLRAALATARSVGDDHGESRMLVHLGMILQDGGRHPEARVVHTQCLEAARRNGAPHTEVVALLNIATTEYQLGRLDEARAFYGDAMRLARELRESRLWAYALTGLAEVSRQRGDSEVSRGLFTKAVAKFRGVEDQGGLAAALLGAGRLEVATGEATRAADLLAEARDIAAAHDVRSVGALAVAYLGLVSARCGTEEEALSAVAESGAMVEDAGTPEATRVEMLFIHALVLRVLLRGLEADRKMLQADSLLQRAIAHLEPDDRRRVLLVISPNREIVAGAGVARAADEARESELSGTVAV